MLDPRIVLPPVTTVHVDPLVDDDDIDHDELPANDMGHVPDLHSRNCAAYASLTTSNEMIIKTFFMRSPLGKRKPPRKGGRGVQKITL